VVGTLVPLGVNLLRGIKPERKGLILTNIS